MKFILAFATALLLVACGDDKVADEEVSTGQRADNQLLKMQDDTVKKAEDTINTALKNQQEALDKVGQ